MGNKKIDQKHEAAEKKLKSECVSFKITQAQVTKDKIHVMNIRDRDLHKEKETALKNMQTTFNDQYKGVIHPDDDNILNPKAFEKDQLGNNSAWEQTKSYLEVPALKFANRRDGPLSESYKTLSTSAGKVDTAYTAFAPIHGLKTALDSMDKDSVVKEELQTTISVLNNRTEALAGRVGMSTDRFKRTEIYKLLDVRPGSDEMLADGAPKAHFPSGLKSFLSSEPIKQAGKIEDKATQLVGYLEGRKGFLEQAEKELGGIKQTIHEAADVLADLDPASKEFAEASEELKNYITAVNGIEQGIVDMDYENQDQLKNDQAAMLGKIESVKKEVTEFKGTIPTPPPPVGNVHRMASH